MAISFVPKWIRPFYLDISIAAILSIVIATIAYTAGQFTDPVKCGNDLWFDGDCNRHYSYMIDWKGDHSRTLRHPLYPLIIYTSVSLIRLLIPDPSIAVRIFMASLAALWVSALFLLLRLMGCRPWDAMLFGLLAACSAATLFWFSVPESWGLGSLTILAPLIVVAIAQRHKVSPFWYIVASAASLSVTVTNWMMGILATLVQHSWRRSLKITGAAFLLVMIPWAIDKSIKYLLNGAAFVASSDIEATQYLLSKESGGPLNVVQSFLFSTIVIPAVQAGETAINPSRSDLRPVAGCMSHGPWPLLMTQTSSIGSGSTWGLVATVLWIILLVLGMWAFFSLKHFVKLRLILGLTVAAQLVLHILFGYETFLYSLHFAPFLLVIAALSTLTRIRPLTIFLVIALTISAGINNVQQFHQALEHLQALKSSTGL